MERDPIGTSGLIRKGIVVPLYLAFMMLAFAAYPMPAQNADESLSSQGGSLLASPSLPKLPSGLFIQDATLFSSALSALPSGTQENISGLPLADSWQTGLGFSIDAGWVKATPLTTVSIASQSVAEYETGERGRSWDEYLNVSVKRLISARLRSEVFSHLVITDQQQFLFGENQSSSLTAASPIATTPAALNLLLSQRNVLFSVGGEVGYDYSARTTLSLEAEAVRNQALGPEDSGISSGGFNSTSESVTGTLSYTLSPRSKVDFSLASSRTTSPLDTSIYESTMGAYVYALSDSWLARVRAGMSVGASVSNPSLPSNTLLLPGAAQAYPIGGVSLEYRRGANSLSLSTNRGVAEVYGAGTGIVWSSNAAWNVVLPRLPLDLFLRTGYDLSESAIQEHISGWRADAGISRHLSRRWSISCQYAFFSNSYRSTAVAQDMHSHGLRLALVWTPAAKGSL